MNQKSLASNKIIQVHRVSIMTPYVLFKNLILSMFIVAYLLLGSTQIATAQNTVQDWNEVSDGTFSVYTASSADDAYLSEIFKSLRKAKLDLRRTLGLALPDDIQIYVHPTIESYNEATSLPWYVAAIANREELRIDMQRAKVLVERQSLDKTLRHELFHLAQEEGLERWQAEGQAMIFAGEVPLTEGLEGVSGEELNYMLEGFASREGLARANATAYFWVQRELTSTKNQ